MNKKFKDMKQILIEGNKQYQWKIIQEEESNRIDGKIPRYPILILTCMNPRIDVYRIFQLKPGDIFVFRNAGNVYTEDVLRSVLVAINQYKIQSIIVLGHLDCGMKKIDLQNLMNKLNDFAIKKIGRSGTNFYLELQKFFKNFTDEIKNIENQVQKFRNARELPTDIKITGMLYDPATGWVFSDEELQRYSNNENFVKDYQKILQAKKYELVDYLEKMEHKIVGETVLQEVEELMEIEENKANRQQVENTNNQESIVCDKLVKIPNESKISNINKIVSSGVHSNLFSIPKIKAPKIYVSKIKVHVPVIYKKREED